MLFGSDDSVQTIYKLPQFAIGNRDNLAHKFDVSWQATYSDV